MNASTRLAALATRAACLAGLAALGAASPAHAADLCAGTGSYPLKPLIGGEATDLCRVKAKAVLVVNTASQCGFTPQYEGLEKLHQRYRDKGLMIVAIPANDFGAQESGSNQDIASFCKINYGVSFTVTEKLVMPIQRDPLFAKLAAASGEMPRWNFYKYLVTSDGKVKSFDSNVEPMSGRLVKAVEGALAAPL